MRKIFFFAAIIFFVVNAFSQTKISSSTFGKMEARWLGPGTMSGRITAIDGVNGDGKTIYVGTAGGGIWKTTNGGASFKPLFDKYCMSIGAIAVDQKNPKVIYAGAGESNMRNTVSIGDGMYKSTDGGENWTKIGLDSTEHIAKIAIDPSNPNTIYVASPGPLWSDGTQRGLFKSTDGGQTWKKILYINEKAGCADIAIDPSNPEIIYASTWEFRRLPYSFNSGGNGSGMYKSLDGGKTWKELTNGLPKKPFGRIAFTLAPSAPNNLVAIVESNETGLFISSDGGETWKQQSATANIVARPFYFSTIAIDPKDPKRVYRPAFTFSYSNDGGYSFADANNVASVFQTNILPRSSCVIAAPYSAQSFTYISAHGIFTFADINHIFVAGSNSYRTNASAKVLIRNTFPVIATIGSLPNTSASTPEVECVLMFVITSNRPAAATAKRTDKSVLDL